MAVLTRGQQICIRCIRVHVPRTSYVNVLYGVAWKITPFVLIVKYMLFWNKLPNFKAF